MAFLNGGSDGGGARAEINMIPLIDVMLVLLVIFMVTAPLITQAVKLDLPQGAAGPRDALEKVDLSIDAEGHFFWDGEAVDAETLGARLTQLGRARPQTEVHLHADQATPYAQVARVLTDSAAAGLSRVGFVTRPE